MTCNDCDGSGDSAKKGQACFRCGGTGELCDACGESCEGGIHAVCLAERMDAGLTANAADDDDLDYG